MKKKIVIPDEPKQDIFYITDAMLSRSILVSVLGIMLCLVCIVSMSWAWFSSSVSGSVSRIKAAHFDMNIAVSDTGTPVVPAAGNRYTLQPDRQYTVSLTPTGDAETATSGYYVITLLPGGAAAASTYYTAILEPAQMSSYGFTVFGFAEMTLTPMWGEIPASAASYTVANGSGVSMPLSSPAPAQLMPPVTEQSEQAAEPPAEQEPTEQEPQENQPPEPTEQTEEPLEQTNGGDNP